MTPPRGGSRSSAGFTLLELLAALAVFGLILVALTSGLRFGQQALRIQARDTEAATQIGPVDSTLRSLIAAAWPGAGGTDARFIGTAATLSFRTIMPKGLANTRTRDADVTIAVDTANRLYLAWLPWYRNWIVARPRPERIDLLGDVDHVQFSYWDPSLNLPPGDWVTAWVGASAPKLLRVRVVFTKGAGMRWPDIIVATARDAWVY
jgi:general secretion pathway protein J